MLQILNVCNNSLKSFITIKLLTMKILIFILSIFIITGCTKDGGAADTNAASSIGKGGSLARFTIVSNFLYLVDDLTLKIFDITDPVNASPKGSISLRFGVETIFPYNDKLFIGSRDGMYIYSITNPASPSLLGEARHTRSCDPVVANDSIAFVTLRGNQPCGPAEDGLYIYNIKNITSPVALTKVRMPTPNGIGLQDSLLYVCQKQNGMRIYNVSNPSAPVLRKTLTTFAFEDVICYNNLLICYTSRGLALYDISVRSNPVFLSEVAN